MGLTSFLARRATRAARVLVVASPDAFAVRVAAERQVVARGWRLAESPADADVLLHVGRVLGEMGEVAGRLWDELPGPRARVAAEIVAAVPAALDEAAALLLDESLQTADAAGRTPPDVGAAEDDKGMRDGDMGHGDMGDGDMDMDMTMSPDGIALASGSEDDRDGLEMDALPVRLGPVLPHWPAGLVVDATLHGDVIAEASARWVGSGGGSPAADDTRLAARACDDLAALLSLAGRGDLANASTAARDALVDGRDADALRFLGTLRRRIVGSRLLRWTLRRTAVLDADRVRRIGLPPAAAGDCYDRLLTLVDRAEDQAAVTPGAAGPALTLDSLGQALLGLDLGAARLLVASLGTPAGEVVTVHG